MNDIKYPEETRQADIIRQLERLQAKARRRKQSISLHGHARDNQATSARDSQSTANRGQK